MSFVASSTHEFSRLLCWMSTACRLTSESSHDGNALIVDLHMDTHAQLTISISQSLNAIRSLSLTFSHMKCRLLVGCYRPCAYHPGPLMDGDLAHSSGSALQANQSLVLAPAVAG